ncbi:uncharacterized protein [Euwallacea similis]|uniref:uncharacterized protein isoform X2 n=1 Tax=Euwallacea similis TaxID=1736056 RepID=UPI00344C84DE
MMESAAPTGFIIDESFKCTLCNASFAKEIRYNSHLGTKLHKSNVKKNRKDYRNHGFGYVSSLSPQINEDPCNYSDYKGSPETFLKNRSIRLPEILHSYIISAIAHWSVDLALNPTIINFKISLENRISDYFGNAVVEIIFSELQDKSSYSVLSLMHFQNVESNITRTIDSFKKGPFNFENILREIGKIKLEHKPNQKVSYCIYSTCQPGIDLYAPITVKFCKACRTAKLICGCQVGIDKDLVVEARYLKKERLALLNTSDYNENVYHFYNDNLGSYFLPKIYIYFKQKGRKEFLGYTANLIAKQLCKNNAEQVAEDYILYVSNWGLERNRLYKLMKEHVLTRLAGLLLKPFRLTSSFLDRTFAASIENFTFWLRATRSVDVTVLESQRDLSKLIKPYNLILGRLLQVEVEELVPLSKTVLKNISNLVLKSYLHEEDQGDGSFQLELLQEIGWRAGLVPLILQAEDPERVGTVVGILENLKKQGFFRRYILVTEHAQSVRTHQKYLSIFFNLNNVCDKLGNSFLEEVKIDFAGESISLQTIDQTDPLFKNTVTPYEFFYMILGESHMKLDTTFRKKDIHYNLVLESQLFNKFRDLLKLKDDKGRIMLRGVSPTLFK